MNMRSTRFQIQFKAHIVSDVVGLVMFAVPVAILLSLFGTPTWAWIIVSFGVWTWASNGIMAYMRKDPKIGRYL